MNPIKSHTPISVLLNLWSETLHPIDKGSDLLNYHEEIDDFLVWADGHDTESQPELTLGESTNAQTIDQYDTHKINEDDRLEPFDTIAEMRMKEAEVVGSGPEKITNRREGMKVTGTVIQPTKVDWFDYRNQKVIFSPEQGEQVYARMSNSCTEDQVTYVLTNKSVTGGNYLCYSATTKPDWYEEIRPLNFDQFPLKVASTEWIHTSLFDFEVSEDGKCWEVKTSNQNSVGFKYIRPRMNYWFSAVQHKIDQLPEYYEVKEHYSGHRDYRELSSFKIVGLKEDYKFEWEK